MIADTEIMIKGIRILTEHLGRIEAERFVALIRREPFDCTEWQRDLWKDKTVEESSREAMEFGRKRVSGETGM